MADYSDSDQTHRTVSKNGKDALQDREIRELVSRVESWEHEEKRVHQSIEEGLRDIRKEVKGVGILSHENEKAVARIEGRQSSNRVWWGGAMTVLLALLGGVWWGIEQGVNAVQSGFRHQTEELGEATHAAIEANHKIDSWIKEATRWGNDLEREDDHNKEQIRKNETKIERCCNRSQKEK